jgi:GT2 family glycosyltransferase
LNNDTVQKSDWMTKLVAIMDSNQTIAAAQPKILNYYEKNRFDYAGGSGGHMDIFCFPFARGRLFLEQENDFGQYNDAQKCFWASGTAMIVRKNLFFSAGKFEDVFFAHMEEIDLCWRFQSMGYEVWVEPNSIVFHKNAISLPMNSKKKYYLNHRNSLIMIMSNYTVLQSLILGNIRLFFEAVAFFYALIKFDFNHMIGIIQSISWLILNPLKILRKRNKFNKIKKISSNEVFKNITFNSIVIQHYILQKKSYSEIVSK